MRAKVIILMCLAFSLMIAGCLPTGGGYSDYDLIEQGESAARRLTSTAEAQAMDLQATQVAFALAQTAQADQLTQVAVVAQATEQVIAHATGTARAEEALTATAAVAASQTALASVQQTATVTAEIGFAQATQSAQATQTAQEEQAARTAANWRTFYGILITGVLVAVLILLIAGLNIFRKHLPDLIEAWQVKYRTIPRANGDPLFAYSGTQHARIVDPTRAAAPVLNIQPTGATLEARAEHPEVQAQLIWRQQMLATLQAMAVLSLPYAQKGQPQTEEILRQLMQHLAGPVPQAATEVLEGQFVILPPEHPEVREILKDVEPRLLTGEGK